MMRAESDEEESYVRGKHLFVVALQADSLQVCCTRINQHNPESDAALALRPHHSVGCYQDKTHDLFRSVLRHGRLLHDDRVKGGPCGTFSSVMATQCPCAQCKQVLFSGIGPRVLLISFGGAIFFGAYETAKGVIVSRYAHQPFLPRKACQNPFFTGSLRQEMDKHRRVHKPNANKLLSASVGC
jgi:hypothetical protein